MSAPSRRSTYSRRKGKNQTAGQRSKTLWWHEDIIKSGGSDRRANAVANDVQKIKNNQEYREAMQMLQAALYGNAGLLAGFGPNSYAKQSAESTQRLALNVVQNNCNAAKSRITKTFPKSTFLSTGGDYILRRRAESLDSYCEGVMYEAKAYDKAIMAFLHCTIWGTGIVKSYIEHGKIRFRNVFPWEFIVDDAEAQHPDELKTVFERRHIDRWTLAKWAEQLEADGDTPEDTRDEGPMFERIMSCAPGQGEGRDVDIKAIADNVVVYEAWHLPSSPDADDGRHVVCTHDVCILDEPYKRHRFPFSKVNWQDAPYGWWGTGLAEILCGIQVEINTLVAEIQEGHHLIKGHYLVHTGAEVIANHINNDLAAIVEWSGAEAPTYQTPVIIAAEVYEHLKWLYQLSSELCGMSAMFATSQKPAGITAAKALETLDDNESERFADQTRNYENLVMDMTENILDLSEELAANDSSFGVTAEDKMALQYIKWSEVKPDRDKVRLKIYPTNLFSTKPSARLQEIQDATNSGWLPQDVAMDLLEYPDVEQYTRRMNGWRRCVENDLAQIADEDKYSGPEPTYDLAKTVGLVRDALNDYKSRGLEESYPERMEKLRQYLQAVLELQAAANPPPAPGPAPGAAGAPGMPAPGGNLAVAPQMAPPPVMNAA